MGYRSGFAALELVLVLILGSALSLLLGQPQALFKRQPLSLDTISAASSSKAELQLLRLQAQQRQLLLQQ